MLTSVTPGQLCVRLARHRHLPGFHRVAVLAITAPLGDEIPAITFDEPDDLSYLHGLGGCSQPWDPDEVAVYCLDPEGHGHRERTSTFDVSTTERPSKMTDEEKAERRMAVENNKKWRVAESVRREFVQGVLACKTPPKAALRFATEFVVSDPDFLGRGPEDLVADLLGQSGEDTTDRWVEKAPVCRESARDKAFAPYGAQISQWSQLQY